MTISGYMVHICVNTVVCYTYRDGLRVCFGMLISIYLYISISVEEPQMKQTTIFQITQKQIKE